MPPASSIISGSQCPAQNGGSIHSAKNTRRRGSPRTESAAVSIVSHICDDDLIAAVDDAESRGETSDRLGDVGERSRIEREHLRRDRTRGRQLAAGDGADGTEVLGHDQIGRERVDQVGVDGVERLPSPTESRTA